MLQSSTFCGAWYNISLLLTEKLDVFWFLWFTWLKFWCIFLSGSDLYQTQSYHHKKIKADLGKKEKKKSFNQFLWYWDEEHPWILINIKREIVILDGSCRCKLKNPTRYAEMRVSVHQMNCLWMRGKFESFKWGFQVKVPLLVQ